MSRRLLARLALCALPLLPLAPLPVAAAPTVNAETLVARHYQQLLQDQQLAELTLLLTQMPKGGDLHHHFSGSIYVENFLDWVEQRGQCIYKEQGPEPEQQPYTIETRERPASPNCLKVPAVRADRGFYRELLQRWSDMDYGNHFHLSIPPDQQFFNTFGYFGNALYKENFLPGLQLLKQRAKGENLQYLETMLIGAPANPNAELDQRLELAIAGGNPAALDAALNAYVDFLSQDGRTQTRINDYVLDLENWAKQVEDPDFTVRFQSYVSRNSAPGKVFAGLYAAFAASQRSAYVVGVNIVGPENGVVAMNDYKLHMRMFGLLKQRFPQTRLAMHAGELRLGLVPPEGLQDHIKLAVTLAGAERIGHGVDIAHEADAPTLLAEMKKRSVAVEINLTSNEFILGVSGDDHPLPLYRRLGIPFVISTDDSGVSRNNLSGEYLLYASRYRPSYKELKQTVYNSLRHAFLPPARKKEEIRKLDQRFRDFEARISELLQLR